MNRKLLFKRKRSVYPFLLRSPSAVTTIPSPESTPLAVLQSPFSSHPPPVCTCFQFLTPASPDCKTHSFHRETTHTHTHTPALALRGLTMCMQRPWRMHLRRMLGLLEEWNGRALCSLPRGPRLNPQSWIRNCRPSCWDWGCSEAYAIVHCGSFNAK
ncbi:hypothetical protein K505DRAFT_86891 [Melanomma pulvis-pyrius CBS 109.77]|uniref:Uncharacterized protein n=1 Tax=Melanomma pulvis-pyrius CBS 109.77 TaxID=1314802 RepID=A0A6A6X164_9PLEO|nr:hypothetical protein K505DRAFT_86891 [Melanomma pulvis-pyrius CBS 109.77]